MAQNSPSNRTPTEVITSVEQWASHALTQPNDPMRKDVAAVLAGCQFSRVQTLMLSCYRTGRRPSESLLDKYNRAAERFDSALSAAGVGGGE